MNSCVIGLIFLFTMLEDRIMFSWVSSFSDWANSEEFSHALEEDIFH